ncbi:MAG: hypothetical protein IIC52_12405, partial [Proteobacteria bacterium]|nr:hypothetical protein [Pseudomonadota bacterium]
ATTAADVVSYIDASGKGTYRYRLRAINGFGASAWTDSYLEVIVTDTTGSTDGGGSKGGGKPCNPKKGEC